MQVLQCFGKQGWIIKRVHNLYQCGPQMLTRVALLPWAQRQSAILWAFEFFGHNIGQGLGLRSWKIYFYF